MFEEEKPVQKLLELDPVQLDTLSIADLQARIGRLREEIARCERLMEAKQRHRSAADQVFGKRD